MPSGCRLTGRLQRGAAVCLHPARQTDAYAGGNFDCFPDADRYCAPHTNAYADRYPVPCAHETAHYYFIGRPGWLGEGAPDFLRSYIAYKAGSQGLSEWRNALLSGSKWTSCLSHHAIENLLHLSYRYPVDPRSAPHVVLEAASPARVRQEILPESVWADDGILAAVAGRGRGCTSPISAPLSATASV